MKKEKASHFYKASCLVKLVFNLAAFANFNHLTQKHEDVRQILSMWKIKTIKFKVQNNQDKENKKLTQLKTEGAPGPA